MELKWITHARAENAEFRILKTGNAAKAYEKNWKAAHVSFSTSKNNPTQHVMTVEYKYGKRIDISIWEDMDRFAVQEGIGRVTIISEKKRSTFSVKNVSMDTASNIKHILQDILNEKQKLGKPLENGHVTRKPGLQPYCSPQKSRIGSEQKRSYSDGKRRSNNQILSNGKRQRSSMSPEKTSKTSFNDKNNNSRKSLGDLKKFQDFRKAQASVRHPRKITAPELCEGKENASPDTMNKIKSGLSKGSFYGTKPTSFESEMNNYRILHTTPSPKAKHHTPVKFSPIRGSSVKSARRSLLLGEKKTDIPRLSDQLFDDNNNNDDVTTKKDSYSFQPLNDKANLVSFGQEGEGFENLGNTCYMNSTLQSLFGLVPFQRDLQSLGQRVNGLLYTDSVLIAILKLMKHKSAAQSEKAILLKQVKRAISSNQNAKHFYGFAQQDAHEFLRLCLDLVQEDVIKVNKKLAENANKISDVATNNNPSSVNDDDNKKLPCPVSQNFSFIVKHQIICSKCKATTSKEDELYDLPVELRQDDGSDRSEAMRLQNLVDLSFASEDVEHECEKCKHSKATVTRTITRLPRIMMIYLKRYSYNHTFDQSEKLRQRVSLSRYLTFHHLCDKDVEHDIPPANESMHSTDPSIGLNHSLYDDSETDRDLVQYMEENDNFNNVVANKKSTKLSFTIGECNNNNETESTEKSCGIQQAYTISDEESELNKALQLSRMQYFENANSSLPDVDKLKSMSEEEQVMLAMQLSMQDDDNNTSLNYDQPNCNGTNNNNAVIHLDSDNNNETPFDANQNLTINCDLSHEVGESRLTGGNSCGQDTKSLVIKNPSRECFKTVSHTKDAKVDYASLASNEEGDLKSKSETKSHNSTASCSSSLSCATVGSTKLDAFFSDEDDVVFQNAPPIDNPTPSVTISSSNPSDTTSKSQDISDALLSTPECNTCLNSKDESEESNEVCKNESTGCLPHSYHLVSIISHKGGSSKFGHYTSDVLTNFSTSKWLCFDDNFVESVTEHEVLLGRQSTSYLLFYLHKDFLPYYLSRK